LELSRKYYIELIVENRLEDSHEDSQSAYDRDFDVGIAAFNYLFSACWLRSNDLQTCYLMQDSLEKGCTVRIWYDGPGRLCVVEARRGNRRDGTDSADSGDGDDAAVLGRAVSRSEALFAGPARLTAAMRWVGSRLTIARVRRSWPCSPAVTPVDVCAVRSVWLRSPFGFF